jgi:Transcriptional regulator, AbiEi antitoxin/AbiEi antitoxin C-terminal domain
MADWGRGTGRVLPANLSGAFPTSVLPWGKPMPSIRPAERAAHLAATQHGVVSAEQCRELGVSDSTIHRRVAAGAWTRVGPGVYRMAGAPRTWEARAFSAVLSAGPEAVASHRTAAHLWGLRGFPPPGRIEITVPRHRRTHDRAGVTVHESLAFNLVEATRRRGVRVTGPSRTFIDLAPVVGDELDLRRALDEIRRLRLAPWTDLWRALLLHARRGRPGIVRAREVLVRRYGGSVPETEFARLFMALLDDAGLPEPVAEHWVHGYGWRYRLDLAYPARLVGIELDGKDGHLNEVAFEVDAVRDNRLLLAGWTVLHYTWRRFIEEPSDVIDEVRVALTPDAT